MLTELKNGAELLECVKVADGYIVLAVLKDGVYVTWRSDDQGNCFWGRYFSGRNAELNARENFATRCTAAIRD